MNDINLLNILNNMSKLDEKVEKSESSPKKVEPKISRELGILESLSNLDKESVNESIESTVEGTTEPVNEVKTVEQEDEVGDVNLPGSKSVTVDNADKVTDAQTQKPADGKEDEVEDEWQVKGDVFQCSACGAFFQGSQCPICGRTNNGQVYGSVMDCSEVEDDEYECEEIYVNMGNALGRVVMTNESEDLSEACGKDMEEGCKGKKCEACASKDCDDEEDDLMDEACGKKKKKYESVEVEEEPIMEATKTVVKGGKLVRVRVKTNKKKRLTANQKKALAKAQKKSHTAGANKARNKSMNIRKKKLGESVEPTTVIVNKGSEPIKLISESKDVLEGLAEELGFKYSNLAGAYVKRLGECKLVLDESEGDIQGTVLYATNRAGQCMSESVLHDLLEESELNLDDIMEVSEKLSDEE